jgi:enoyl-[acyl-carrier protein] reductase I
MYYMLNTSLILEMLTMMSLKGRYYVITGIASERSIAYAIAQSLRKRGAELILTYQSDRFAERLKEYATTLGAIQTIECDFNIPGAAEKLSASVKDCTSQIHGIVHAIAYAEPSQLQGDLIDVMTKEGFLKAHEISSYSLCLLTQALRPYLIEGESSIIALTYIGSNRFIPHYNVMALAKASLEACIRYLAGNLGPQGIRVNGLSSGPIRTLAASGIKGLKDMIPEVAERSLLKRAVQATEIGEAAAFLLSPMSSAITGQIIYADAGYSSAG